MVSSSAYKEGKLSSAEASDDRSGPISTPRSAGERGFHLVSQEQVGGQVGLARLDEHRDRPKRVRTSPAPLKVGDDALRAEAGDEHSGLPGVRDGTEVDHP